MRRPSPPVAFLLVAATVGIALLCLYSGSYLGAAMALNGGLFVWFGLMFGLNGSLNPTKQQAAYCVGVLATAAPLIISFAVATASTPAGSSSVLKAATVLVLFCVAAYRIWPYSKAAIIVLLPSQRPEL